MDMLRFAVVVVCWVAGSDAVGKCHPSRKYQKLPGLRVVAAHVIRPHLGQPVQTPIKFGCVEACNAIQTCMAFQVLGNGTCEVVLSTMHAFTTDNESALYTTDELQCPSGSADIHQSGDFVPSCYIFVLQRMNWTAARDRCLGLGGDLVSIESEEEQLLIQYIIGNDSSLALTGHIGYWTSGLDDKGSWIWKATGNPLTYRNWYPGEPSNAGFVMWIGLYSLYTWDDIPKAANMYPLCEIRSLF